MAKFNQDAITTSPELSAGAALIAEEKAFFLKQVWPLWALNSLPQCSKKVIIKKLVVSALEKRNDTLVIKEE